MRKQRAARQQGALTEERICILKAIGFEFGEEANITASWELHFDLLMDWLLLQVSASLLPPHLLSDPLAIPPTAFWTRSLLVGTRVETKAASLCFPSLEHAAVFLSQQAAS